MRARAATTLGKVQEMSGPTPNRPFEAAVGALSAEGNRRERLMTGGFSPWLALPDRAAARIPDSRYCGGHPLPSIRDL